MAPEPKRPRKPAAPRTSAAPRKRAPRKPKAPPPPRQLLRFLVGGEEFAAPLDRVREVLPATRPRPVPSPTPWLRGVVDVRGRLIAVCDLAERLGRRSAPPDHRAKIVVVDAAGRDVGLAVEGVTGVVELAEAALEPLADASELVSAVAHGPDGRLVLLLDVDRACAQDP